MDSGTCMSPTHLVCLCEFVILKSCSDKTSNEYWWTWLFLSSMNGAKHHACLNHWIPPMSYMERHIQQSLTLRHRDCPLYSCWGKIIPCFLFHWCITPLTSFVEPNSVIMMPGEGSWTLTAVAYLDSLSPSGERGLAPIICPPFWICDSDVGVLVLNICGSSQVPTSLASDSVSYPVHDPTVPSRVVGVARRICLLDSLQASGQVTQTPLWEHHGI